MTVAHIISGPLDLMLELGVPFLIFLGLYWWSSRKKSRAPRATPAVPTDGETSEKVVRS